MSVCETTGGASAAANTRSGAQRVLDALPGALLAFDAHSGRIWLANPRAAELLECEPRLLEGNTVAAVFAPVEWLVANRHLPQPDRGRAVTLPSGRRLLAGFTLADLEGESGAALLLHFQDIGPWEQLRVERNRLLQLAAVGSALPAVLHELKNPLAAVTTTAEVLLEEVEGHVQEQLHAILSELRRLRLTIDGVGAVGQGLRSVRHAAVDLACREAWGILEARAELAGLRSRCQVEDMPLLPLDPSVIRAIVYNLVSNAIQACAPGDTVNLYAHLVEGGRELELVVVDDGPGMTAQVLTRCTELFFTTRRHGSGIGLALVNGAVEGAGGRLVVESVPGFGTSVTVRVPVAPLQAASERAAARQEAGWRGSTS
jgi:signal transduction histidine kinase